MGHKESREVCGESIQWVTGLVVSHVGPNCSGLITVK